jgi:hypothetical protein
MRSPRLLLAGLFVLSLAAAAPAADEGYAIKVRRPARGGDAFDVHLLFEQTHQETALSSATKSTLPAAGIRPLTRPASAPATAPVPASLPAPTTHVIKADLTCKVEVVETNFRGQTSLWVTVQKFVSLVDNKEIVPAGKVIGILGDGTDVYLSLRSGDQLSEDARTVLKHLYPLSYQLDETSFGSKTPRKAGESWEVDALSVSQIDSDSTHQIDPKTVRGKVTLVGPEPCPAPAKPAPIPGIRLNVDLACSGKDRIPKTNGEQIDHQDSKKQISALFPLDPALPPAEFQITTDTTGTLSRTLERNGPDLELKFQTRTHTVEKQTITPARRSSP